MLAAVFFVVRFQLGLGERPQRQFAFSRMCVLGVAGARAVVSTAVAFALHVVGHVDAMVERLECGFEYACVCPHMCGVTYFYLPHLVNYRAVAIVNRKRIVHIYSQEIATYADYQTRAASVLSITGRASEQELSVARRSGLFH